MEATFLEHVKVDKITEADDRYIIQSGTSTITANHVVVAGGSLSPQIIPGLQMTTVKGQCMQFDAKNIKLPYTLFHKGCYVVPRPDSTIVVGATMEEHITDLCTTKKGTSQLHAIAESFIPGLSRLPMLRHWAGLRPKTIDELPYVGRIAEKKNMFLAAGHFRKAFY